MSKVGIVTDTMSCLPAEIVKEYDIRREDAGLKGWRVLSGFLIGNSLGPRGRYSSEFNLKKVVPKCKNEPGRKRVYINR